MQEKEEDFLKQEDIDLIFTGKRPDDMPYEVFKVVRAELKKATKQYLKGKMVHVSSSPKLITQEDGKQEWDYSSRVTKTYIKPKEDGK